MAMLGTGICYYYSENQVFGDVTIWDMSLNQTVGYMFCIALWRLLTLRLIYNNFGRSHYQHTPLLLLQNFLTRPIENVKYIEIDDSFSLGASNCHLLWKLNLGTFKVYQNDFRVYRNILTLYNDILRIARNLLETREKIQIESHSFYHIICDRQSWGWSN